MISDIMDEMGLFEQAMRADIRPLFPEAVVAGVAATAITADVYDQAIDTLTGEMEFVDGLKDGEVAVVSTNHSTRAALWGELLSTASRARGARGAIIDGLTRDVGKIIEIRFPVFASGIRPISSSGRCKIIGTGCPVECGEVLVNPGDLIFGDIDGVVIPRDSAEDVISRALDKVQRESATRSELASGALLREVFKKYGAL